MNKGSRHSNDLHVDVASPLLDGPLKAVGCVITMAQAGYELVQLHRMCRSSYMT